MIARLLIDAERLLKKAKRKVEWQKRVVVADETWDALSEAHRALMVLSTELHYESGRVMAMMPPQKGQPPLNPMAMPWASKLDRIEMAVTRAMWGVRREHPMSDEQSAAEAEELEADIVRALH